MSSHFDRQVGRRFERSNRPDPRFFRGHQRPGFFYSHPGHHRFGGHWHQPTAEQLAFRSTAAEVARLFLIAARTSQGHAEQQAHRRAFLERSRKELSDLIDGTSQHPQHTNTEEKPKVGISVIFRAGKCGRMKRKRVFNSNIYATYSPLIGQLLSQKGLGQSSIIYEKSEEFLRWMSCSRGLTALCVL